LNGFDSLDGNEIALPLSKLILYANQVSIYPCLIFSLCLSLDPLGFAAGICAALFFVQAPAGGICLPVANSQSRFYLWVHLWARAVRKMNMA
jgi:hypothetical protein